jgi:hypothetical protein
MHCRLGEMGRAGSTARRSIQDEHKNACAVVDIPGAQLVLHPARLALWSSAGLSTRRSLSAIAATRASVRFGGLGPASTELLEKLGTRSAGHHVRYPRTGNTRCRATNGRLVARCLGRCSPVGPRRIKLPCFPCFGGYATSHSPPSPAYSLSISLRLFPTQPSSCCGSCKHCWPLAWPRPNRYVQPPCYTTTFCHCQWLPPPSTHKSRTHVTRPRLPRFCPLPIPPRIAIPRSMTRNRS